MHKIPRNPSKLLMFFCKKHNTKLILLLIGVTLFGAMPSIDMYILKKITDVFYENIDLSEQKTMWFWILVYCLWWETLNILGRLHDYLYLKTWPIIKADIINSLFNYVQRHGPRFFAENTSGAITNRIIESAKGAEEIFFLSSERVLRRFAATLIALSFMYNIHKVFATIFVIWLALFCGFNVLCSRAMNKYSRHLSITRSNIAGKLVDAFMNINVIRIFANHRYEYQYIKNFTDEMVFTEQKFQWFVVRMRYLLGTSCSLMIFVMVYYLFLLKPQGIITVGDCVLILGLSSSIVGDIWDLNEDIGNLFEEIGRFNSIIPFLREHELEDKTDRHLAITNGKIEFQDVEFKYTSGPSFFNRKNIIIKGKEHIGLVGFSGSGKSTFVNLINRSFDIEAGKIMIDDQDISAVSLDSLHQHISFIPQEPILFNRSIRENIGYAKLDATDEEIHEAAKKAYIHDVILGLKDGYETYCGEKGAALSGGQRQRIAIARAILRNSPILILDEATSALDSLTEELIQNSLQYLMKEKTVIIIAHKLTTLLDMDRILVFDQGNVVEEGTHQELLKTGGLYFKLWTTQFKNINL